MKKKVPSYGFLNGETERVCYDDYEFHVSQELIDNEKNEDVKKMMEFNNSIPQAEIIEHLREQDRLSSALQSMVPEEAIKNVGSVILENTIMNSEKGCCGGAPEEFKKIIEEELKRRNEQPKKRRRRGGCRGCAKAKAKLREELKKREMEDGRNKD